MSSSWAVNVAAQKVLGKQTSSDNSKKEGNDVTSVVDVVVETSIGQSAEGGVENQKSESQESSFEKFTKSKAQASAAAKIRQMKTKTSEVNIGGEFLLSGNFFRYFLVCSRSLSHTHFFLILLDNQDSQVRIGVLGLPL